MTIEREEWEEVCASLLSEHAERRQAAEKQLGHLQQQQAWPSLQTLLQSVLSSSTQDMAIYEAIRTFRMQVLRQGGQEGMAQWILHTLWPILIARFLAGALSDAILGEFMRTLAVTIKTEWGQQSATEQATAVQKACGPVLLALSSPQPPQGQTLYLHLLAAQALLCEFGAGEQSSGYGVGWEQHYQALVTFYQAGIVAQLWHGGLTLWQALGQGHQHEEERVLHALLELMGVILRWNFVAATEPGDAGLAQFHAWIEDPTGADIHGWKGPSVEEAWARESWNEGGLYHLLVPTLQSALPSRILLVGWDLMIRMSEFLPPAGPSRSTYTRVMLTAWTQLFPSTTGDTAHYLVTCIRQGLTTVDGLVYLQHEPAVASEFLATLAGFTRTQLADLTLSVETVREIVTLWATLGATTGLVSMEMTGALYSLWTQRCERQVAQNEEWGVEQERWSGAYELAEEELENMSFLGRHALSSTLGPWIHSLEQLGAMPTPLNAQHTALLCEVLWWVGGLIADRADGEEALVPDAIEQRLEYQQAVHHILTLVQGITQRALSSSPSSQLPPTLLQGTLLWFWARVAPTYLREQGKDGQAMGEMMVALACGSLVWPSEECVPLRQLASGLLESVVPVRGVLEASGVWELLGQEMERIMSSTALLMSWEEATLHSFTRALFQLYPPSPSLALLQTIQRRLVTLIAHTASGHAPELTHYVQMVAGCLDSQSAVSLQVVEMLDALVVSLRRSGSPACMAGVVHIFHRFLEVAYDCLEHGETFDLPCRKVLEATYELLGQRKKTGNERESEGWVDGWEALLLLLGQLTERYRLMESPMQEVLVQSIASFLPLLFASEQPTDGWLVYPPLAHSATSWVRAVALQPALALRLPTSVFHQLMLQCIPHCTRLGQPELTQQALEGWQHLLHFLLLVPDHPGIAQHWQGHDALDTRVIEYLLAQLPMQGTLLPAACAHAADSLLFLLIRVPALFQQVATQLIQSVARTHEQERLRHLFTGLCGPPLRTDTDPEALGKPNRRLFQQRYGAYHKQVFLLLQYK